MKEDIITFIQDKLLDGQTTIGHEDDLLTSGLIDSIGMMKLVTYLEEEYHVRIPPEDMIIDHFITVSAIESFLSRRQGAKPN